MATDDIWPRLLSLAVHELRTPTTVVGGYIRMLLKDHAGPLSDDQRRLMLEAEKSFGRISGLLAEMSELAHVELGDAPFHLHTFDVAALITCVRRERTTASSVVVQLSSRPESVVVAIGGPEEVASLLDPARSAGPDAFDEFRGGMGLALPLARRVIDRHGGRLLLLPEQPKGGVAVLFPIGRQGKWT